MHKYRYTLLIVGAWAMVSLTGCQTGTYSQKEGMGGRYQSTYTPTAREISIHDLARQLGMRVTETNGTYVKLQNDRDTVLVFTYENAQFYVNGKPEGLVGRTKEVSGVLQVESGLVERVKLCLESSRGPLKPLTPTTPRRAARGTVVIDPGHGGKDPGATSVLGFPEKDINLAVARSLGTILQSQGFAVVFTRDTDRYISLEQRAAVANWKKADLFISIHADYCGTPSVTGFTVYTARSASDRAERLARSVEKTMISTGFQSRGVRGADYRVLVQTRCPAILVELGYLSNYWESRRLRDQQVQQNLANAIAQGTAKLYGARLTQSGAGGSGSSHSFAYPAY